MIFDFWATLWKRPEVAPEKITRALKRQLDEVELAHTVQVLEPVIRDAATQSGTKILTFEPGFCRFNGTPKVPAVNFRVEGELDTINKCMNLISASEEKPRLRGRDVPGSWEEGVDQFRRLLDEK